MPSNSITLVFCLGLALTVGLVGFFVVYCFWRLAIKHAIYDMPNERSSHKSPVPRLGGAAFIPICLLGLLWAWETYDMLMPEKVAYLVGASALYLVSLVDDLHPLPNMFRFSVQSIASLGCLIVVQFFTENGIVLYNYPNWLSILLVALWIVGMTNIYNFMDGIDGMAGIQAVTAGGGWLLIGITLHCAGIATLGLVMVSGVVGFLVLNWHPAKIFMGDAGSIVLGYTFSLAPVLLMQECPPSVVTLEYALLVSCILLWPFVSDGLFTIFRRLKKRENVFRAHRSHLYQRLVISGESHSKVATAYASIGVFCSVLGWLVVTRQMPTVAIVCCLLVSMFLIIWLWAKKCEKVHSKL